jgi:uncharacterized protein
MQKPFLSAEWRNLIMINYEVEPEVLQPYLPAGIELDLFEGKAYVSLVAFHFLKTKVGGIGFPFHKDFEEVNLRFYVKYKENNEWKRGVVFISEIVPKRMIVWVARVFYREKYTYAPMKSTIDESEKRKLFFSWGEGMPYSIEVLTSSFIQPMPAGSKEEFIFEHYWGYTSLPGNRTGEYKVEHPSWNTYPVIDCKVKADFKQLYGNDFSFLNHKSPDSVFVAEGSPVNVYARRILES